MSKARTGLFLLGVLVLLGLCESVSRAEGMISWWTFDEGSGTIAHDSVGLNHANIMDGVWAIGKVDGALGFVNAAGAEVPYSTDFDNLNAITIEAWTFRTDTGYCKFIIRGDWYFEPWWIGSGGDVLWGALRSPGYMFCTASGLSTNAWQHVAMTYDSAGDSPAIRLYIDGVEVASQPHSGTALLDASESVYIGGGFNGILDEVVIYDCALSAQEIASHAGVTLGPASVTYDGDTLVSTEGNATATACLVATLRDSDENVVDLDGEEVTFTITDEGVYTGVVSAVTMDGIATASKALEPGIYDVLVSPASYDVIGSAFLTVYNPEGGFVTGGGWIDSPAGAYVAEPTLTGKANFGFVSKYKKGATVPTGNTEFQFNAGDLNFHSSSYEWLVVTGSDYARFKGTGTINGYGGQYGDYKFMLWAGDDAPDTFRIRIWEEDEASGVETDVYDNGSDQSIGGGSIIVHTGK